MKSGFALRWKLAACVLLAGVAIGLGGESPGSAPEPAAVPAARGADESKLILGFSGHVRFLNPDGTETSRLAGDTVPKAEPRAAGESFGPCGRGAPDGRLPLDTRKGLYLLKPGDRPVVTPVRSASGGAALFAADKVPYIAAWSPDGTKAVGVRFMNAPFALLWYEHVVIDLAAGTVTELKLPRRHRVVDWSPDGTWFLTIRDDRSWGPESLTAPRRVLCKVSADGETVEALTTTSAPSHSELVENAALSPDGQRVAYQLSTTTPVQQDGRRVHYAGFKVVVLDLSRMSRTEVALQPGGNEADGRSHMSTAFGVRWSPDGTRVGFLSEYRQFGTPFIVGWRVGVVGADGRGAKTVFASDKAEPNTPPLPLTLFDWR